jgi:hypothetical protein
MAALVAGSGAAPVARPSRSDCARACARRSPAATPRSAATTSREMSARYRRFRTPTPSMRSTSRLGRDGDAGARAAAAANQHVASWGVQSRSWSPRQRQARAASNRATSGRPVACTASHSAAACRRSTGTGGSRRGAPARTRGPRQIVPSRSAQSRATAYSPSTRRASARRSAGIRHSSTVSPYSRSPLVISPDSLSSATSSSCASGGLSLSGCGRRMSPRQSAAAIARSVSSVSSAAPVPLTKTHRSPAFSFDHQGPRTPSFTNALTVHGPAARWRLT